MWSWTDSSPSRKAVPSSEAFEVRLRAEAATAASTACFVCSLSSVALERSLSSASTARSSALRLAAVTLSFISCRSCCLSSSMPAMVAARPAHFSCSVRSSKRVSEARSSSAKESLFCLRASASCLQEQSVCSTLVVNSSRRAISSCCVRFSAWPLLVETALAISSRLVVSFAQVACESASSALRPSSRDVSCSISFLRSSRSSRLLTAWFSIFSSLVSEASARSRKA
mmetsp:Transcript_21198/g.46756  ORF Transcript_21198/g.46756 Transcript_21198/m.46756 type:complete len:228 (-) Transcript_21198:314-997(-)